MTPEQVNSYLEVASFLKDLFLALGLPGFALGVIGFFTLRSTQKVKEDPTPVVDTHDPHVMGEELNILKSNQKIIIKHVEQLTSTSARMERRAEEIRDATIRIETRQMGGRE